MIAGGAGAAVLATLGYRAWDRGVFLAGEGPAYEPWNDWQGHLDEGIARPLHAAILAANPHDTQPWLFEPRDDSITLYADRSRNLGAFDPFRREMHLGLGCAVENLTRAANAFGYAASVQLSQGGLILSPGPKPVLAAQIMLEPMAVRRDALFESIPRRHTNRGPYRNQPVDSKRLRTIADRASTPNLRVALVTDAGARKEIGAIIAEATEKIIADPEMSADSARWFRTGRREIELHRDGVTTDTAGLSPPMWIGAKLMPDQDAKSADQYWLSMTRDTQVATAPMFGMILVRARLDMASAIEAGRAWQYLHLSATANGLAAQPMNQPVEMVDRDAMLGRKDDLGPALSKLAKIAGWEATFVFRMGYAERPALPSPRRPLRDVMIARA